jgi:Zn-dependent peptidase ImmA (M78 family)
VTLPRGFKARAEREAERLRSEVGLRPDATLDVQELAGHLKTQIVCADKLIAIERLEELERIQAFSFSAATFKISGRNYIVTSPLRSAERRNSDIAHELAHILLEHELSEIREVDGVPFRTCRPEEEEQATAFGGTIMLPSQLLLAAASRGQGPAEIAAANAVSVEMARFRYNTTGVAKQAKRQPV